MQTNEIGKGMLEAGRHPAVSLKVGRADGYAPDCAVGNLGFAVGLDERGWQASDSPVMTRSVGTPLTSIDWYSCSGNVASKAAIFGDYSTVPSQFPLENDLREAETHHLPIHRHPSQHNPRFQGFAKDRVLEMIV
jgi:hypothetical protein